MEAQEQRGGGGVHIDLPQFSTHLATRTLLERIASRLGCVHVVPAGELGVDQPHESLVFHAEPCHDHLVGAEHHVLPQVEFLLAEFFDKIAHALGVVAQPLVALSGRACLLDEREVVEILLVTFPLLAHVTLPLQDVVGRLVLQQRVTHDCEHSVGVFLEAGSLVEGLVVVYSAFDSGSAPLERPAGHHCVALFALLQLELVEQVVDARTPGRIFVALAGLSHYADVGSALGVGVGQNAEAVGERGHPHGAVLALHSIKFQIRERLRQ